MPPTVAAAGCRRQRCWSIAAPTPCAPCPRALPAPPLPYPFYPLPPFCDYVVRCRCPTPPYGCGFVGSPPGGWIVIALTPFPGYVAALAPARRPSLRCQFRLAPHNLAPCVAVPLRNRGIACAPQLYPPAAAAPNAHLPAARFVTLVVLIAYRLRCDLIAAPRRLPLIATALAGG